jgi:hypothetical protein
VLIESADFLDLQAKLAGVLKTGALNKQNNSVPPAGQVGEAALAPNHRQPGAGRDGFHSVPDISSALLATPAALAQLLRPDSLAQAKPAAGSALPKKDGYKLQVAQGPYVTRGVVLDYSTINGSPSSFTFSNNWTYWISNSFTVGSYGGTAMFQPNSVIKYATNAWLIVYGYVSFPTSGAPVVFTSQDDDIYGETITGHSTHVPYNAASRALMVYYSGRSYAIANSRFRWAQIGIRFDENNGVSVAHTVSNCKFENGTIGIYQNVPSGSVTLSQVTYVNVTTPISNVGGFLYGSMTANADVVNVSHMRGNQAEATIAINPTNSSNIATLSVMDSNPGLFSGVTTNGGTVWTTNKIATGTDIPSALGDPSASFDAFGNLFLTYAESPVGTNNTTNVWVVLSTVQRPHYHRSERPSGHLVHVY